MAALLCTGFDERLPLGWIRRGKMPLELPVYPGTLGASNISRICTARGQEKQGVSVPLTYANSNLAFYIDVTKSWQSPYSRSCTFILKQLSDSPWAQNEGWRLRPQTPAFYILTR